MTTSLVCFQEILLNTHIINNNFSHVHDKTSKFYMNFCPYESLTSWKWFRAQNNYIFWNLSIIASTKSNHVEATTRKPVSSILFLQLQLYSRIVVKLWERYPFKNTCLLHLDLQNGIFLKSPKIERKVNQKRCMVYFSWLAFMTLI